MSLRAQELNSLAAEDVPEPGGAGLDAVVPTAAGSQDTLSCAPVDVADPGLLGGGRAIVSLSWVHTILCEYTTEFEFYSLPQNVTIL